MSHSDYGQRHCFWTCRNTSKLIWMISIFKIILNMTLIWNRLENSDFDFKSFLDRQFWFWFEIILEMILPITECCLWPSKVHQFQYNHNLKIICKFLDFLHGAFSALMHRLGGRKGIRPVKTDWWGTGVVICLEQGANDLHMVQLMPLPTHHLLLQ